MTDEFHTKLLGLGLTEEDIANTPVAVLAVLKLQMIRIEQLEKRVAELEQKLGMNSSNSSKPPSSDSPYDKQHHRKKRQQAKKAARKGHRQQMLEPTETLVVLPEPCSCGCCKHDHLEIIIHENRSRKAFEKLIGDWEGLLVSDGYGLYRNWVWGRQTCLAHLIRRARGLSEHQDKEIARCGTWAYKELKLLNSFAKAPPNNGQWNAFYARFCQLIQKNRDRKDDAGKLIRHLEDEMAHLWTFLQESGVDSTNNLAERLLRFGVLWRTRSQGPRTDNGLRFVERMLRVKQTMTIQKKSKSSFSLLVEAIARFFQKKTPDFGVLGLSSVGATL